METTNFLVLSTVANVMDTSSGLKCHLILTNLNYTNLSHQSSKFDILHNTILKVLYMFELAEQNSH